MNINLFFTVFMIMAGFVFLAVSEKAESLDITKIIEGTVKEIKADSIEILDVSNSKVIRLSIDSNTVYDGVQKLTDLKEGDKVQIQYELSHGKNVATMITKMEEEV